MLDLVFLTDHDHSEAESDPEIAFCDATKQLLIQCPPQVLTLHLKRFCHQGKRFKKNNRHISFPVLLDLKQFCTHDSQVRSAAASCMLMSPFSVLAKCS